MPVNLCDRLAADPEDRDRALESGKPVAGVPDVADIDGPRAVTACLKALGDFPGVARFRFQLGRAYVAAKNYDSAFEQLRIAAEEGHAVAQNDLGSLYFNGLGVEKDQQTAVEWFERAGAAGVASAQMSLGTIYEKGLAGVTPDRAKAKEWYRKAAAQGHVKAAQALARLGG